MVKDISAPLHAASILVGLACDEYRPALARMAMYMRKYQTDPELPKDQVRAARDALRELEHRLR
jgi:hypothetical protein